jgi:hypothetical protein
MDGFILLETGGNAHQAATVERYVNTPSETLPETGGNAQAATVERYVNTPNQEGFCPGDKVVIDWDRYFKFGRSLRSMQTTPLQGQTAMVTKVTPQYVYIVVLPDQEPFRKKNHNVSL